MYNSLSGQMNTGFRALRRREGEKKICFFLIDFDNGRAAGGFKSRGGTRVCVHIHRTVHTTPTTSVDTITKYIL